MPQDVLRTAIVDFLRGYEKNSAGRWHYREMYQLATALEGEPLSSPVEFVLDPETMRFYSVSEKGTEKLLHIARNPAVSLSWVQRIDAGNAADFPRGYFGAVGIQIRGRARIVPPEDPGVMGMLNLYMPTLPNFPGLPAWNPADTARVRRLFAAQSVIEIVPDWILITNAAWSRDPAGYLAKQIWRPLTSETAPASSR
jgi:nitroimidazol reductase NimA-like FMN-containing flavoprotein (pyridoxamine 5'-phosphate oxidase superfamily)